MSEGSTGAPTRHPIQWQDPVFYDEEALDKESRRVFDVCHTCRRCFNLCDSFPRLFDLIDESESMELDTVDSADFSRVVDACTLCDMCYTAVCPYVPPHEFNIDFPHLMLRHRAVQFRKGRVGGVDRALTETDRNGRLAGSVAGLANWANSAGNTLTRPLLEKVAHVHREAALPRFNRQTLVKRAKAPAPIDASAPAHGRKVVIYATCFANYNNPEIGMAARAVLARNGVETEVVYPRCCGMPQLEQGNIERVAEHARTVAGELEGWIDKGYDIVALVPSCALMLKSEWPLILPDDEKVDKLAKATRDVAEYVVEIARNEGLAEGLSPLPGGVALHLACHARAQNMGPKAAEMLQLIPQTEVDVTARCSGHGGSWGIKKENFEVALKVGRPVARKIAQSGKSYLASECPLAQEHIVQGMERRNDDDDQPPLQTLHPIQLMARAYGIDTAN